MSAPLDASELGATAEWIASVQLPSGMIPWYVGGHADPWNHTEAAMALSALGSWEAAERAFEWLAATQLPDGSWCRYHLGYGIEDPQRDPNVAAYVATGTWWHYLQRGDLAFLEWMWPVVEKAVEFALSLQLPGGEVLWCKDPDGVVGRYALLSCTSSIYHSIRCAVAVAEAAGRQRPEWELAAHRMAEALVARPNSFAPKDRWAMDWYYPVLCGALPGAAGWRRLEGRWEEFVMDGLGVRCVSDQPWVTTAETAELVMALDAVGRCAEAQEVLGWTRHLREEDGSYWTGCVHPQCVRYPGGERTTYSAAAVILADHALYGESGASGLFRGETLGSVPDAEAMGEPLCEP